MKINGFQKEVKEKTLDWLKKQTPKYEELKYFKEAKPKKTSVMKFKN